MPRAITRKGTRKGFLIFVILIISSLILPFALAQNDPGHDSLYIEEVGDSEIEGSLNITGNVSIEGGRQALINYLDIYFNGQTIASPSVPTIAGTINDLYLDAKSGGNVYINAMASSGTVFLGSTGDTVNLNITGALYFNNDRLATSSGSAADNNLYWGDKLVCNTSVSNCGWVSSTTGGGDITAVNTNDDWLLGGAETGDVSLTFNESKLNGTIDARATALGDGNNYTTAAGFVTSGSTKTLQIEIRGRSNVTASFTDTDTTYSNGTGLALSSTTFSIKSCGNTEILKYNTTTSAWECKTDETGSGADGNNYTTAAGFTSSGLTKTIQIAIVGRDNVTASWTDNNTDTTYTNGTGLALSGTTFSLAAGVMTAGSYGNSTVVPVCTFDTYGRATSCTNTSISFPATATDQNNYTTSIVITGAATKNITLTRQGMINISATFTDIDTTIGNCSTQYSCGAIMYSGNMTGYLNTSTGNTYINVTTGANYHTIFLNSSTGNTKINTSTYGPSGITAGKYGNSTIVPVCTYDTYGRATSCTNTSISFPAATTDQNNYTTSAGVTSNGLTKTIQIAIIGRPNVTASWTDNNTDTTYSNGTGLALSGTTFSLAAGVMTAGSYGNSTVVPVCTYDTYGRATSCTNTSISYPTGGNLSAQGATAGYIPQFQNGSILNNSIISQSGNTLTITGNISMPANFYIGSGASATGSDSFAIGGSASSIGARSAAIGRGAISNGEFSVALGDSANSSQYSVAIGYNAKTLDYGTAVGRETYALTSSTALGNAANASGSNSIAVGAGTKATGIYSLAIGEVAQATAQYATAIGYGVVNDVANTTKFGNNVTAPALCIGTDCRASWPSSTGGGNLSAQGATAGYIPQFQNGSILNNSIISQSGNTLTINGNISMPANFYIGSGAISTGHATIAIGTQANASRERSAAIGYQAKTGYQAAALGYVASATGDGAIAIGQSSLASTNSAIAMGNTANSIGDATIAIGAYANASLDRSAAIGYLAKTGYEAAAIGYQASAMGFYAIAIGTQANATANYATAMGYQASTTGTNTITIGTQANTTADQATAIGYQASTTGTNTITIGTQANTTANVATAIGYQAKATGGTAIAIGERASASQYGAIAMGEDANSAGADRSIAIGSPSNATGSAAIAIGANAQAPGGGVISIGYQANAANWESLAVGYQANANQYAAIAVGKSSSALNAYATAIGYQANATGVESTAIGSKANATADDTIAIGYLTNANAYAAIAIGTNTSATANTATAIGLQTRATAQYATAIGYGVVNDITNSTKLGGMVILSGELNATSHNVTSVNCIVFDSGGKICTGG